ncbi:OmpH family outer membrane protein [bacterium]|nr:OmpH family outer membrane protein [bacterium]
MFNRRTAVLLFCLVLLFSTGSVFAQLKLGYVDSQRILSTNADAKDAQQKLEAEAAKWTQELQRMEQEIKEKMETLEQQSLLLSEEKKQERIQELQGLQEQAQQYQLNKWGDNGEAFKLRQQFLGPVYEKINAAIHKVGEEGSYDFIFDTVNGNLLYAENKYDLTDLVIEELEKATASTSSE